MNANRKRPNMSMPASSCSEHPKRFTMDAMDIFCYALLISYLLFVIVGAITMIIAIMLCIKLLLT